MIGIRGIVDSAERQLYVPGGRLRVRRGQHTLNPNATDAKADSGDARISGCVEKSQDDFLERRET